MAAVCTMRRQQMEQIQFEQLLQINCTMGSNTPRRIRASRQAHGYLPLLAVLFIFFILMLF